MMLPYIVVNGKKVSEFHNMIANYEYEEPGMVPSMVVFGDSPRKTGNFYMRPNGIPPIGNEKIRPGCGDLIFRSTSEFSSFVEKDLANLTKETFYGNMEHCKDMIPYFYQSNIRNQNCGA